MTRIDKPLLHALLERERDEVRAGAPARRGPPYDAAEHLFGRVPMTWMTKWSGGFPLYLDRASGNRVR